MVSQFAIENVPSSALPWFRYDFIFFSVSLHCWIGTWPPYYPCFPITPAPCMLFGSSRAMHYPLHVRSRFWFLFSILSFWLFWPSFVVSFLCFFFFLLLTWWCLDDDSFQGTPGNGSEVDHENGSALWGGTFWLLFPKQNTRRISDITFFYLVLIKHVNHECFSEAKMLAKWWMGFSHLWKSTTYFEYCRNV